MEQDPHSDIKFPQEIRQITTTNEIATVETYYENGNVSERAHVKNGIAEGQSQSFSREGVLLCGANFHSGRLEGEVNIYDEVGVLSHKASYVEGVLDGRMLVYVGGALTAAAFFLNLNGSADTT